MTLVATTGVPAALSQAAANLFSNSAPPADLDLSARVTAIDVNPALGGLQLVIRVRVTVAAADQPLGVIEVAGEGPFVEYGRPQLEGAAARATRQMAEEFLAAFPEGSPRLVQWLAQRGLVKASDYARPARAPNRFAASAGAGAVAGGDGGLVAGFGLEARQTIHWFTIALSASHSSPGFQAATPGTTTSFPANITTWDLGLEPGVSFSLLPNLDLRAGPGLHLLFGDATASGGELSQSYSKLGMDAWASLSVAVLPSHFGSRMLLSLIGKIYLLSSADLPRLSRRVPITDNSFMLTIGYEWNVGGGLR